jgi:hypothetical protein
MASFAKIHLKEFCSLYTFKKNSKEEAIPEPCLLMINTCQMSTGALKLFLRLIRFTKSLNRIMFLLYFKEAEEEKDSFQALRTFFF